VNEPPPRSWPDWHTGQTARARAATPHCPRPRTAAHSAYLARAAGSSSGILGARLDARQPPRVLRRACVLRVLHSRLSISQAPRSPRSLTRGISLPIAVPQRCIRLSQTKSRPRAAEPPYGLNRIRRLAHRATYMSRADTAHAAAAPPDPHAAPVDGRGWARAVPARTRYWRDAIARIATLLPPAVRFFTSMHMRPSG